MPPFEYEKHIGSASMQRVATSNRFLMAFFSFERVTGPEKRPSVSLLYQATRHLSSGCHTSRTLQDCASSLASIADYAYDVRRLDMVARASQLILGLAFSDKFETAGHFYEALSLNQFGCGNTAQANSMFKEIADSGHPHQRAKAMLALGSNSLAACDNQTATFLYREIMGIIKRDRYFDPATVYFTGRMTAVVKAADGDHQGALADLEKMFPLVRMASARQPYAYYDYLNSLAVELTEAGRLEEARNASRIALASPFAHAYPEWRDTLDEIDRRELRASRSTVAFTQRALKEKNLVVMPTLRRGLPMTAQAENSQPSARIIKFPIRTASTPELNERRQELEPFDKRRIVSEKLYEMFLSVLDDGPLNRDLVEELYKTFLQKRKQS